MGYIEEMRQLVGNRPLLLPGDEVYNVTAIYLTRDFRGEPRVDQVEVTDFAFFGPTALPSGISPPDIPALAALRGR